MRSRRRLRWLVAVGSAVAAACVLILGLLRFGDPQWHGRVYVFQEYISPGRRDLRPPDGYDGVWRHWYRSGQLRVEMHLEGGVPHGDYTLWWENGGKCAEGAFRKGKAEGVWRYWDEDGNPY